MNYKWELYRGSRKIECPRCGRRRFVPFVDVRDHKTPADIHMYGRCDREQECGYFRYPSGIKQSEDIRRIPPRPFIPIVFDKNKVITSTQTPLFEYACKLAGYENARKAWERYNIGAYGTATLFWQIDIKGRVKAGKAIQYGADGHRLKETALPVIWLHKSKRAANWYSGTDLQQCFYGEHLLNENKDAEICIVESEKTAVIMSALYPDKLWLASGGSCGMKNKEKNKPLEKRNVTLLPDEGQYYNWALIAKSNGWRCLRIMEQECYVFKGADILDYVEKQIYSNL